MDRIGSLDDALAWAEEIAGLAPLSLAYTKLALNGGRDGALTAEIQLALDRVWTSADAEEGLRARAERRPPRFSGA